MPILQLNQLKGKVQFMQVKGQGSESCAHCSCSSTGSKALAPAAMSDPTVPPLSPPCVLTPHPNCKAEKFTSSR